MRRGWRWLVPLAAVPVLTLLAYGFALNPRDVPSPLVGRPAASFALTSFDGARLQLSELRGKVVVVNFWASWCYPACYEEAPALEAVEEFDEDYPEERGADEPDAETAAAPTETVDSDVAEVAEEDRNPR